jgi:hypothetical protein
MAATLPDMALTVAARTTPSGMDVSSAGRLLHDLVSPPEQGLFAGRKDLSMTLIGGWLLW